MIRISYKESTAGAHQLPAYHTGHHTLEFSGDVVTIGRSRVCDLIVADELVSGVHCELRVSSGVLFVVDLDSTNGTFANQVGVSSRRLSSGDVVQIGATTFIASHEEVTETSGLHPPGTVRSRIEPPSLERRPTVAVAAQGRTPRARAAVSAPPPAAEPRPMNSSLLWAGGLGLGYLLFESGAMALLLVGSLFGLDAIRRHLDNQSLILKELRRLRGARLPSESEPANL